MRSGSILRASSVRVSHFAYKNPDACLLSTGESDEHRRCKIEIYEALLTPNVTDVALERPLGTNRPDVSAIVNGAPVAIEVQWTPYLDGVRYSPRLWEKWIHEAYFGRVYYWLEGLTVASYRFEPFLKHVPQQNWNSPRGEIIAGGYIRRSRRYRSPARSETLNLATDFAPKQREWWKGGDFVIPNAKLFMPPFN